MTPKTVLEVAEWIWSHVPKKKRRIVIVEDDPVQAKLLVSCLASDGIKREALVADTAEAALAMIERNQISVIFVDLRLKYMNGWELIPVIQQHSPHTLIVVTCGQLEDVLKIKTDAWSFHVMPKPVSVAKLERFFSITKV